MVGRSTPRSRPLNRTVVAFVLGVIALSLPCAQAHAQSARASFFLQMLRQNADARVRVSAALRLAELREAATVDPIIQAFGSERDASVQAAIVDALARIGDARALPTIQTALRSSNAAVSAQARRALPILQAAANTSGTPPATNGTPPPTTASGAARLLISLGAVSNGSGIRGSALQQIATDALRNSLSRRSEVVVHAGPVTSAQQLIRSRRLAGHFFDANIQSIQPRGNGVRAAVSIAVSSYPGRVYEFESQTAITISGSSGDADQTQEDAVRRALESAVNRAIEQLLSGGR